MGIYDRDYYGGSRGRPATWAQVGLGRARVMSFTAWVIAINIVVFVIGNVLLGHTAVKSTAGDWFVANATDQDRAGAFVDTSVTINDPRVTAAVPSLPGAQFHPIYPQRPAAADPATGRGLDRQGRPLPIIGVERFVLAPLLSALGSFSTGKALLELEVWRFVTFQFLHANVMHILFNMLGLWFVGGIVESYLGFRRFATFYLICGMCGALSYLILNVLGWGFGLRIPGVLFTDPYTPLVGASAGVFGVLLAAAYIRPRDVVYVMFALPMQLRTAVYLFTALAALNLFTGGANAGGDAAHMGGAIAGAYFIRHAGVLDRIAGLLGGRGSAGPRRVVRRGPSAASRAEVDRILEKVRAEGLGSLTPQERETLRRASEGLSD